MWFRLFRRDVEAAKDAALGIGESGQEGGVAAAGDAGAGRPGAGQEAVGRAEAVEDDGSGEGQGEAAARAGKV